MKKKYIIIFIALMIIILSISVGACKPAGLEQRLFDRSEISRTSVDAEVTVGDITWKVENAEYLGSQIPSDTGFALESVYGRFIGVDFSVENTGDDILTLIDLKVIDSNGREFPICAAAYGYIGVEEACLLVEVFPNIKQTFFASFDVPVDSVDLILEVSDLNAPPEEKAYIDLGL
jgi:hypothetical protein